MKRAILCTLIAAALLLSACTRASESTVRAPDAGAPLTLCLGAGPQRSTPRARKTASARRMSSISLPA